MEDFIALCKNQTSDALTSFLNDLRFVPADKLTWSPAPTAKSALQIAAHCAGHSSAFAWIIRAGKFPCTLDEFIAKIQSATASITTLEEAKTMLRAGIAETIAAYDTVRPEQISAVVDTPHGQTPFTFFLTLPARHLNNHGAQIDYLQTCWGDMEIRL